jgi:hypothetical protein
MHTFHALVQTFPGLEKALEARKKERSLAKFRSSAGQADSHPPELAFAVDVQLASCYAANKLWTESLDLYSTLVKNSKGLPLQASR